jgi:PTH1 family peptidyl-tRNA hydrolase
VKLVVGLGNPGPEYADTRHNVGFRIVERLAERHGIALRRERRFHGLFGDGVVCSVATGLLEPQTFMNLSGRAVVAAVDALPLGDLASDLVVVYDDLDLPFGRLRVRPAGGAGGHNGLGDIQERLGRSDFPRLRFGIGRPPPGEDPVEYVLAPFDVEQRAALDARLALAADAVEAILAEGAATAMNRFNAIRPEDPAT